MDGVDTKISRLQESLRNCDCLPLLFLTLEEQPQALKCWRITQATPIYVRIYLSDTIVIEGMSSLMLVKTAVHGYHVFSRWCGSLNVGISSLPYTILAIGMTGYTMAVYHTAENNWWPLPKIRNKMALSGERCWKIRGANFLEVVWYLVHHPVEAYIEGCALSDDNCKVLYSLDQTPRRLYEGGDYFFQHCWTPLKSRNPTFCRCRRRWKRVRGEWSCSRRLLVALYRYSHCLYDAIKLCTHNVCSCAHMCYTRILAAAILLESGNYVFQHCWKWDDNLRAATNREWRLIERMWYVSEKLSFKDYYPFRS